jgi:tRNA modification GTPase
VVLHVLDSGAPLTAEDEADLERFAHKPRILVRNKSDLPPRLVLPRDVGAPVVDVCALTGAGLEALKDAVRNLVFAGGIRGEMLEVMINTRHQDALRRAREGVERAADVLRGDHGLELAALELRIGVDAVGEIVGATTTEDLLDSIFRQFCIGK